MQKTHFPLIPNGTQIEMNTGSQTARRQRVDGGMLSACQPLPAHAYPPRSDKFPTPLFQISAPSAGIGNSPPRCRTLRVGFQGWRRELAVISARTDAGSGYAREKTPNAPADPASVEQVIHHYASTTHIPPPPPLCRWCE